MKKYPWQEENFNEVLYEKILREEIHSLKIFSDLEEELKKDAQEIYDHKHAVARIALKGRPEMN